MEGQGGSVVNTVEHTPSVSIVMPLYNKAEQVLGSIATVMAQSISDWELVVVDDGSTDCGPDLVRTLKDERIHLVTQANAGVSAARNKGIAQARADLLAFLDADDLWMPGFLASVLELQADFPQARWIATGYEIRPAKGPAIASRLGGLDPTFKRGLLPDYFCVAIASDPPVCSSAVAVRRDAILAMGGFPVGIGSGEDLLTWARLAVRYPLAYEAKAHAVFVVSGIERRPDASDRVGRALDAVVQEHSETPGLQAYLGLWYRMQAVMAMRFNDSALARRCAWRAVLHGPRQLRNPYTLLLAMLPTRLRKVLDVGLRKLLKSTKPDASS